MLVAMATGGSQVLLVDDDESLRETFSDILRDEGYSVSAAENGRSALLYLASHDLPQVIFLDLMMPVMSGAEFREKQLAEPRLVDIPVIVMSAADRGGVISKRLRADGFVSKPPSAKVVLDTVARYCERGGPGDHATKPHDRAS
jgi:CheY-like chemotaxis protein